MSVAPVEAGPGRRAAKPADDGPDAPGAEDAGRRVRASHGFVTLGVALAVVGVLAGALFGSGNVDHLVELLPGRAWLANDDRGSVTLVNGATGEPEFEMRFAGAAGDEFEVVQGSEGVFVVNRTTGEITRIDGATQTVGGSIKVDVADEPLFLIGGGRAYLVLRALGTIQEIDPGSPDLAPVGDPVQLGAAVGSAVVDDAGTLGAAVLGTGEVVFVQGASIAGRAAVNPPGDPLVVTLVQDEIVAVAQDLTKDEVTVEQVQTSGSTRSQRVDVPADGEIRVAPKMDGDRLWLLHVESSTIAGVSLTGGETRTLALDFAKGDDLGAPLPNGSFVYVPNFDQGALLKVDAETGAFVDIVKVGDDTEEFEAFVENGRVWGNDPVGGTAVVIDRDGNVRNVDKYRPGIPTSDGTGIPIPVDPGLKPVDPRAGDPGRDPGDPTQDPTTDPTTPAGRGAPADPAGRGPIEPFQPTFPGPVAGPADPLGPTGTAPATPTDPIARTAPAAGVPGVPGAVSAAGGDASATVSWLPALDNGSAITAYRIVASTGATQTVSGSTTSVTFTGLANGTTVSFAVNAENAIGAGPAATSNVVTPVLAIPGPPTSVDFRLTQPTFEVAVITASWDLPVENPSSVAEWHLTCSGAGASMPFEFTAPAGARSLTLDTLPAFDDYFCGIQAVAVDGTPSPDVTMTSGTTLKPLQAPPPPQCTTWYELNRQDPTDPIPDAYADRCTIEPPSTSIPISGYIVDVHDGVSIVDHQMLDATATQWTSGRLASPIQSKVASFYSYYTDPVSGLSVTSAAWTHVA